MKVEPWDSWVHGHRAGTVPDMLAREEGQILPGLLMLMVVTLSLGILFFQVGKASVLRSDAQNAADAAALAGAKEIQRQLQLQYATYGYTSPSAIDVVAVEAEMAEYARKNGGVLVDKEINALAVDVKAWTKSEDELGEDAEPADAQDVQGTARARAQVALGPYSLGDPAGLGGTVTPGTVAPGDVPRISDEDWKELEKKIGPEPRDCPDVIALGLLLVERGFMVWQNAHPALGGDAGHEDSPGSPHHSCNDMGALDVNFGRAGDLVPEEVRAIDPIIAPLQELGYSTIWRASGHYNHLHVDIETGNIGAGSTNMGGFAGPLAHASLEIRLVDWEKPVAGLVDIGGPWPTVSSLAGPPDPQIMALMCQMAAPFGPKILLATFETAIVESGIKNLDFGHADSHGVFQQQWTTGWGTLADTMHPPTATRMFLEAAVKVARDNPGMSAGQIAATVQRPREDLRGRYDEVKEQAQALIARTC
jgi:Putative Flp pilus-assembly TadE/G-like